MRKRNFKGRCTKRYVPKCMDICRTYDALQEAYADELSQSDDVEEFRCNVYLEGLAEGDYTTDFVCTKTDGTIMVRECVYRSRLINYYAKKRFADWFVEKMLFPLGCVLFAVVVFAILIHFDLIWYMW